MPLEQSGGLPQLFSRVCRDHAERPAIHFDRGSAISYAELDRWSNQLAHYLLDNGIGKADTVAICMEKCATAYVLPFAALKIGAPYFFIDPRNPPERALRILAQCEPKAIFCNEGYAVPTSVQRVVCPGGDALPEFMRTARSCDLPAAEVTGADPAYVMFTSGSTGFPKGAVISHDNLLHFIDWIRTLGFTPEDIHTNLNPLYFDNSVFDLYSTFFTGGQLVPFDAETVQNPIALVARLKATGCSVWFSVPSLLMYLQTMKLAKLDRLDTLRWIIFGGEGYPKVRLKELYEELGDVAKILNVYGPTECTCICSAYRVTAADFGELDGLPPLGSLNPQFSYRLLDGDQEVKIGEPGELCLGGSCVGLGYYNQPELSASAFVQNPLNNRFREILYRTGDLVRIDPADRKLHFVGRRDSQIKHMGYRIELEEIRHAILQLGGIDDAIALQRKSADFSEIIAVVASTGKLEGRDLKRRLAEVLPKYMIPSKIYLLSQMPKNANGKTDRRALVEAYAG